MPTPSFGDQWGPEIIGDPELRDRAHYKPYTLGGTNNHRLQPPVRALGSLMDDNGAYAVFDDSSSRVENSTHSRHPSPQTWRHTSRRQALARDSYARRRCSLTGSSAGGGPPAVLDGAEPGITQLGARPEARTGGGGSLFFRSPTVLC